MTLVQSTRPNERKRDHKRHKGEGDNASEQGDNAISLHPSRMGGARGVRQTNLLNHRDLTDSRSRFVVGWRGVEIDPARFFWGASNTTGLLP